MISKSHLNFGFSKNAQTEALNPPFYPTHLLNLHSTLQCFIVVDNQWVTLNVQCFNPSAILQFTGGRLPSLQKVAKHGEQVCNLLSVLCLSNKKNIGKEIIFFPMLFYFDPTFLNLYVSVFTSWRFNKVQKWNFAEGLKHWTFSVMPWLSATMKHWRVECRLSKYVG